MTDPTICVITPTIGRPSLRNTLESGVLGEGDSWRVIADGEVAHIVMMANIKNLLHTMPYVCLRAYLGTRGDYGNRLRDMAMSIARENYFVFLDDDDIFAPGAVKIIKEAIAKHYPRPIIFKMINGNGEILWRNREVTPGNVGGSMFVCPNIPGKLGKWDNGAGHRSDYEFIRQTLESYGPGWRQEIVWSDEVIIHCRPGSVKSE